MEDYIQRQRTLEKSGGGLHPAKACKTAHAVLAHHQRSQVHTLLPLPWPCAQGVRPESGKPGFDSRFRLGSFSGSSHASDLKTGTRGAWVTAGIGWSSVSTL